MKPKELKAKRSGCRSCGQPIHAHCPQGLCLGMKIAEQLEFTPKEDRVDTLQCVLLRPGACVPSKGTPLSAGYDLHAVESLEVPPHGQATIGMGIALEIKPGWY